MRKSLAVLAAAVALLSLPAGSAIAADHIVTPDAVQARLSGAEAQRAQDVSTVQGALSSDVAAEAAAAVGADLDRVRAGVAMLSDAELRDLAARASVLETDPVAGLTRNQSLLLTIALVLIVIILVLAIVD